MSVSGSLAGGGEVTIDLRWLTAPSLGGLVGPRVLIESTSVSNVPATCSALEGDEFSQPATTALSGSLLFHAITEVPSTPIEENAPEHSVSLAITVGEYEEDLHDLHGDVFVSQAENASGLSTCIANNYPADWEVTLPHDWYGR